MYCHSLVSFFNGQATRRYGDVSNVSNTNTTSQASFTNTLLENCANPFIRTTSSPLTVQAAITSSFYNNANYLLPSLHPQSIRKSNEIPKLLRGNKPDVTQNMAKLELAPLNIQDESLPVSFISAKDSILDCHGKFFPSRTHEQISDNSSNSDDDDETDTGTQLSANIPHSFSYGLHFPSLDYSHNKPSLGIVLQQQASTLNRQSSSLVRLLFLFRLISQLLTRM